MRSRRTTRLGSYIALFLMASVTLGSLGLLGDSTASAEDIQLEVRVTIERVTSINDMEGPIGGDEDFYATVYIDNVDLGSSDTIDDDPDITPNWQFTHAVDLSAGSVPVLIQIWEDDDGIFRGGDDHADIDPGPGRDVDITVSLAPCGVTGEHTGDCGTTFISQGTGDDETRVHFRVEVVEPAYAPGLRVQCLHDAIWPQPGDTVEIEARATDGTANARIADSIEIWVDETPDVNDVSDPAAAGYDRGLYKHTTGPLSSSFAYGCRVEDDGLVAWSGWRRVSVGIPDDIDALPPHYSGSVPVFLTGPRSSRVDVIFIADTEDFGSAENASFQLGVRNSINTFFRHDVFLRHQNLFNFWIALDTGNADDGTDGDCDHSAVRPSWMDAGAVLHSALTRDLGNCAKRDKHLFSATVLDITSMLHEAGHVPFGLADEYAPNGGYWETDNVPNVYERLIDCIADAPNLGRTGADCRSFDDDSWWIFKDTWHVSDPATNDMMVSKGIPQGSDIRRIEWFFNECRSGRC